MSTFKLPKLSIDEIVEARKVLYHYTMMYQPHPRGRVILVKPIERIVWFIHQPGPWNDFRLLLHELHPEYKDMMSHIYSRRAAERYMAKMLPTIYPTRRARLYWRLHLSWLHSRPRKVYKAIQRFIKGGA